MLASQPAHERRTPDFFAARRGGALRRSRSSGGGRSFGSSRCGCGRLRSFRFRGSRCGCRSLLRRFCLGWRSRSSRARSVRVNQRDDGLNRHGLAFIDLDFFQYAGGGRRNLGVHLVGGNLEERLVALDFIARLLQPLRDGAFENAFAHLGHDDVNSHRRLL